MMVTFVAECEKKALNKTRRVLDAFANRVGVDRKTGKKVSFGVVRVACVPFYRSLKGDTFSAGCSVKKIPILECW